MTATTVHSAYSTLLHEMAPSAIVWVSGKRLLKASEVLAELAQGSDLGVHYALNVSVQMQTLLAKQLNGTLTTAPESLDVSVSPREVIMEVLSKADMAKVVVKQGQTAWSVSAMLDALQERTPEGLRYATDVLRIARDFVARRAAVQLDCEVTP